MTSYSIEASQDEINKIPNEIKRKLLDSATRVAFSSNRKQIKLFLLDTLTKYYLLGEKCKFLLAEKEQSNG